LRVTAGRGCPSQWQPQPSLYVFGQRIDHSAFLVTLGCPQEPAVNERVDLAVGKFDRETAIAGPTPRSAATHSLCSGFSSNNGFCR
jgi:hypothetical protein